MSAWGTRRRSGTTRVSRRSHSLPSGAWSHGGRERADGRQSSACEARKQRMFLYRLQVKAVRLGVKYIVRGHFAHASFLPFLYVAARKSCLALVTRLPSPRTASWPCCAASRVPDGSPSARVSQVTLTSKLHLVERYESSLKHQFSTVSIFRNHSAPVSSLAWPPSDSSPVTLRPPTNPRRFWTH